MGGTLEATQEKALEQLEIHADRFLPNEAA
jgi:hypothetical protein